jgi:hypothetical protein
MEKGEKIEKYRKNRDERVVRKL